MPPAGESNRGAEGPVHRLGLLVHLLGGKIYTANRPGVPALQAQTTEYY